MWDPALQAAALMPCDNLTFVARAALCGDWSAMKKVGVSRELVSEHRDRVALPFAIKSALADVSPLSLSRAIPRPTHPPIVGGVSGRSIKRL